MTRAALAAAIVAACKASAPAFDPSTTQAIASEDVELAVGGNQVGATITHPKSGSHHPAIVFIAGSGPTDRDWNNALIASKNGSGTLLGDAVAAHGAVVLRFDKAGVGKNTTPIADITVDTYRDEALAGLAALRVRRDVDPTKLFVAGHSEGGLHAIRTALAAPPGLAGVLLLSSPGRSMADVLYAQVDKQLHERAPQIADAELATLKRALDDIVAGKPVDPMTASTLPPLQQLVAALVAPQSAKIVHGMFGLDPSALAAQIAVPVFVYNGNKDVQIDPIADAGRLARALRDAHRDATVFLAPDADHVLKHETKTLDQLRADLTTTQADYNSPARSLDDATVAAIVAWIARVTAASRS